MADQARRSRASQGGRPRDGSLDQAILDAAVALVLEHGFRALSIEAIAVRSGVGRATIYRRWTNKAAIVMDAFVQRVHVETRFLPAKSFTESIRTQMRTMAKALRGNDGILFRTLLAESQFDQELAEALYQQWTAPRRKMATEYFRKGIDEGHLRADIDINAIIDVLYAPLYYRLLMRTGELSDAYVDTIFANTFTNANPV